MYTHNYVEEREGVVYILTSQNAKTEGISSKLMWNKETTGINKINLAEKCSQNKNEKPFIFLGRFPQYLKKVNLN